MGSARSLEERENLRKNLPLITLENDHKITSKDKFSTQNVQNPYHLHPALSNSLHKGIDTEILSGCVGYLFRQKLEIMRQPSFLIVQRIFWASPENTVMEFCQE